jgi:hypothetical protein
MRLEEFLFCEMARNEANGQISLIGLFPGDLLIVGLPPEVEFNMIPNLHCVVILGGMDRVQGLRYQCAVRSNAADVITVPSEHINRPEPLPLQNLLFGFQPFPCSQGPGDYEFRVTVQPDDAPTPTTYSKTFKIQRRAATRRTSH